MVESKQISLIFRVFPSPYPGQEAEKTRVSTIDTEGCLGVPLVDMNRLFSHCESLRFA